MLVTKQLPTYVFHYSPSVALRSLPATCLHPWKVSVPDYIRLVLDCFAAAVKHSGVWSWYEWIRSTKTPVSPLRMKTRMFTC